MSSSSNNTNNSSKTYKRYFYIDVQKVRYLKDTILILFSSKSFKLFHIVRVVSIRVSTEKRAHAFRKALALNKYYIYNLLFFWLINLGATLSRHVPRRVQIRLILNGKNFFVILVIARAIRTATLSLAISEIFGCFFSFYSFRTHSLLPSMRLHYSISNFH